MNIQHLEKGLHYSDRDLILFARKIGKLATYCRYVKDESSVIRVETERRETKKERDSVKMMIQVDLPKKILRAESRKETPIDALENCVDKLYPQIEKYKEILLSKETTEKERYETEILLVKAVLAMEDYIEKREKERSEMTEEENLAIDKLIADTCAKSRAIYTACIEAEKEEYRECTRGLLKLAKLVIPECIFQFIPEKRLEEIAASLI